MSVLVTTLRTVLATADAHFGAGRVAAARRVFEDLVERSQARTDRPMEVVARAMLARCHLRARDLEGARDQLRAAARLADATHHESYGRYLGALVRVAVEEGPPSVAREEALSYLRWAEEAGAGHEVLDACLLLAWQCDAEQRVDWLQRGIDDALARGGHPELGRAYNDLGAALDQGGRGEEALDAYEMALQCHQDDRALGRGDARSVVAAGWAVGAVACRLEEWPLARARLEDALRLAEGADDCLDLLGLILGDLAAVYEAAGDVIEARRLILRALSVGAQQELALVWPQRWRALQEQARRLEVA